VVFRNAPLARMTRAAFLACIVGSGFVSETAEAQSLADKETARALMDQGDAKRDAKDYKGALKAYEGADAIMHVPTTGLEVARMQAQLGMLLEARDTLSRVIRIPAKPHEPAPFTAARKAADQLNDELAKRVPAVQVEIKGVEPGTTPEVTIDGEAVPPAVLSVPRKVNPGSHTIVVRAGSASKSEDVLVAEKETKTVTIDLAAPVMVAEAEPEQEPVQVQTTDDPAASGSSSTGKVLMFGGFGLAAVGVGIGAVTGLMSMSKVDEIKPDCIGDQCPPSRAGDIDDARSLGNISTIAFIAGGAFATIGIIGLVMSSGHKDEAKPAVAAKPRRVGPVVSPTYVGLSGSF
jgi:hypothetical protein